MSQDHHRHIFSSKKFKIKLKKVEIKGTATLINNDISFFSCFGRYAPVAMSTLYTMHILGYTPASHMEVMINKVS